MLKTSPLSTLPRVFCAHYSSRLPCVGFICGIWGSDANHSDNLASQADVGYEKYMDCDVSCGVVTLQHF